MSAIDQFKDAQIDLLKTTVAEYAQRIDALEAALDSDREYIGRLLDKIANLEEEIHIARG